MSTRSEVFTSRWGMLLAMLGMAIGTGNIWRFPRIAASNGGGSFLVAWVIFLLLWSIPLLILEFGMGKGTRRGSIGSFVKTIGPKFAWMGAWIAWVAVAILFYYTVVMGWTIRFFFATVTGEIPTEMPGSFWDAFNSTPQAVGFHALAVGLGIFVVARGVRGIEKAARFLIPSLVILVVVLAIKALTLPGASEGLAFLFTPDFSELGDVRIWLEALTQNAWDTGAGWGLVLTYAVYMRSREDTALNAFVIGFGNNSMSLLAGIMVLCTIFSVMPEAAGEIVGAGNEGLTFIWVPQLFAQIPGGQFFMGLFFLALVFAAWSSLVAMIELAVRILIDLGLTRKRAIIAVGSTGFLLGIPSALRLGIFQNQDWVWGVGLMLSGFFFAFAVLRYGVTKWREKFINTSDSDVRIGRWWDWAMRLVAVEAVVLTVWFLIQAGGDNFWSAETWTLFSPYNVGSVLIQFGVVLLGLLALNRWMANRIMALQDGGGAD
ncbi:MAG: sodium-dependent transporter [Gemmatimonadetes bacterium]|nr:sodium-dependent transporter [Gemmatimonadota bacterium]MYC92653.1 sodium-dependent transporter [Gemmatimonadota bacterium]MYG34230.1 sodium-dependent transporter [Gemmatimonadota bacterium]